MKVPTSRLDSWSLLLSEYDFDIVHKAGKANVNADALPRIPVHVINLPYEPVWDKEHILIEQERNPRIAAVKSKVDMGEELGYFIDSDRLLYKFNEDNRNGMFVVPRTLQYKVLTAYHNLPFAGHQGVKCTYDLIKSMFFWDEMSQTFARIASRCCTQTHSKHQTCTPTEVSRGHCSFPENWYEHLGPLPTTYKGIKYILCFQDAFLKYLEAICLPEQKVETVAKAFVIEVVSMYGEPEQCFPKEEHILCRNS
ncbi:hypothetical protein PR048_024323 [Dryococelus australis]|uniref:RNA-directed DNA polymerase n=1 Tax=Dryococelus australis TaxID=614101 RepID=A0ABQ9GNB0_9NEOP|nr:hypothetical protein PR048_024323 [Dryococelus australis]